MSPQLSDSLRLDKCTMPVETQVLATQHVPKSVLHCAVLHEHHQKSPPLLPAAELELVGRHCVWRCQAGVASRSSHGMVSDSMCAHSMCLLAPSYRSQLQDGHHLVSRPICCNSRSIVVVLQPSTLSLAVLKSAQCVHCCCVCLVFRWDDDLLVTRAPGRLDVMGGIADYSGSLVLQMPIAEACHVALQRHPLDKQKVWKHVQVRLVGQSGRVTHSVAGERRRTFVPYALPRRKAARRKVQV